MEHERAIQNLAVESYLLGEMSPSERESFEEHYFECAICAQDLRAAAQFMEDAKDILAAGGASAASARTNAREVTAPAQSRWTWLNWLQPQAAAAMIAALVLIVGIETFSTIPGLRRQVDEIATPRVVQSVVLRPVIRGDASTVRVNANEPVVLVFDPPDSPQLSAGSPLKFIVTAADGRSVLELSGVAPNPGEMITLSIPRLTVPDGDYTLIIKGAVSGAGSSTTAANLGQYPFNVHH